MGGELRRGTSFTNSYDRAREWALAENLVIYNGRSRRAMRFVFYQHQPLMRQVEKATFEEVKMRPFEPGRLVGTADHRRLLKIFHIDNWEGEKDE